MQESKHPDILQSVFPFLSRLHLRPPIYFSLPLNTVYWHILSCLQPQIHKPLLAGWGARDISSSPWRRSWEDVHAGGCCELHAGSLCSDSLCWRISLRLEPDVAPADAVQPSHAAVAGPLRSDPRPPPGTPLSLSPPSPGQHLILSRESSPCQIAWWFLM